MLFLDELLKNGSIGGMEVAKQVLVRDKPCLVSEKETVSFVTLFVLPEADAANAYSEQVEVKKRTTVKKMEKNKLNVILRTFLESIQVCPSIS